MTQHSSATCYSPLTLPLFSLLHLLSVQCLQHEENFQPLVTGNVILPLRNRSSAKAGSSFVSEAMTRFSPRCQHVYFHVDKFSLRLFLAPEFWMKGWCLVVLAFPESNSCDTSNLARLGTSYTPGFVKPILCVHNFTTKKQCALTLQSEQKGVVTNT